MYLIPKPQKIEQMEGVFLLCWGDRLVLEPSCGAEAFAWAEMLNGELGEDLGYRLSVTRGNASRSVPAQEAGAASCLSLMDSRRREAGHSAVLLAVDPVPGAAEEGYRLTVDEQGVRVAGHSMEGLFYGIQTLRQMVRQCGASLPFLQIEDWPEFPNRGYYLDVTRGRIPTLSYLKETVDRLAFYKVNQFQLYIEHSFLFAGMSEVWRDDTPLTAEEILELDRYCRERCVELVPSLASFGHLYKVLRTRTFRQLCELPGEADRPFGFEERMAHHTLDVSAPESLAFSKQLIGEYMELFSSRKFNICADETFDLGKGRSRELAQEKGVDRLYIDFVRELCEFVAERGRTPLFWGDIIQDFPEAVRELPEGTVCLNWGYSPDETEEATRKLAGAGAVQYCCPGVSGWNELANRLGDGYRNIRRMCGYARKYGAVGILNTDWGDYGHVSHPDFSIPGMIYGAAFSWNLQEFGEPLPVPEAGAVSPQESGGCHPLPETEPADGGMPSAGKCCREKESRQGRESEPVQDVEECPFLGSEGEFRELNRQISRLEYLDRSERVVSLAAEIPEHSSFGWGHLIRYLEGRSPAAAREQIARMPGDRAALLELERQFYALLPELDRARRSCVRPYLIAIQGTLLLEEVGAIFGEQDRTALAGKAGLPGTGEGCRDAAGEAAFCISGQADAELGGCEDAAAEAEAFHGSLDPVTLAVRLEEWLYGYKALWRTVSRESELFRIQDVILACADRLRELQSE